MRGVLGLVGVGCVRVGFGCGRVVGFPGWVVVHDPEGAGLALGLVGDLGRVARLAGSRPGRAMGVVEEVAGVLGGCAPHFLPTFLEEGARVFLGVGNRVCAARLFSLAREAERVHGLVVDEVRDREVFLEFALAGAVGAGEMGRLARSLPGRTCPGEALEAFLGLNVERVRGGMPPYASLGADLGRLAVAAGVDPGQVQARLLTALLPLPATSRAPAGFWRTHRQTLTTLTHTNPQTRRLLEDLIRSNPRIRRALADDPGPGPQAQAAPSPTGQAAPAPSVEPASSVEPDAFVVSWAQPRAGSRTPTRADVLALGRTMHGYPTPMGYMGRLVLVAVTHPEVLLACAAMPSHCAAVPGQRPDWVRGAAALHAALADAGLVTPRTTAYSFTFPRGTEPYACGTQVGDDQATGTVIDTRLSRINQDEFTVCTVLSLTGTVPARVGPYPTTRLMGSSGVGADAVSDAFTRLLRQGPPPWDPRRAEALAQGTGWSVAAAQLLLTEIPAMLWNWPRAVLEDLRRRLHLSAAQAQGASSFLSHLDPALLVGMIGAGAADPARVVAQGLDAEAMAAYWQAHRAGWVVLPDVLAPEALTVMGREADIDLYALMRRGVDQRTRLEPLLWLASRLERDHPARPWLADQLEVLKGSWRERSWQVRVDDGAQACAVLGLPPRADGRVGDGRTGGAWTLTDGRAGHLVWEPAKVTDWRAEAARVAALGELADYLHAPVVLLSGRCEELVADLRVAGTGAGQDPLASAPQVVADVSAALGLGADAARYWLQLLALHHPADRQVRTWNHWGAARLRQAGADLLARGLVVEARRERAGRSLFLPGGWMPARAPHHPMEAWKAPLYDLDRSDRVRPRLAAVLPLLPLGQVFAGAWRRYRDGDRPGYTEPSTQTRRR